MARLQGLMLGSAAALCGVASAQAADLPAAKAAPVEYVRICTTHGRASFMFPAPTAACASRAAFVPIISMPNRQPFSGHHRLSGPRPESISITARLQRTVCCARTSATRSIAIRARSPARGRSARTRKSSRPICSSGVSPPVGSLHFSRTRHFRRRISAICASTIRPMRTSTSSPTPTPSAMVSRRRCRLRMRLNAASATTGFPALRARRAAPVFAPIPFTYGGERMPDIVSNLRYIGTWGSVQLSGALHQIRDVAAGVATVDGVPVPVINPITGLPNPTFADTDYGFALALNAHVNLPYLGAGDEALDVGNLHGRCRRLHQCRPSRARSTTARSAPVRSRCPSLMRLSIRSRVNFKTNKAYGIAGGLNHYWNPTFQTNIYRVVDALRCSRHRPSTLVPASAATIAAGTAGTVTGWSTSTNTASAPIRSGRRYPALIFGVEVLYTRVDPRGRVAVPITNSPATRQGFQTDRTGDIWEGRLRIQRDF